MSVGNNSTGCSCGLRIAPGCCHRSPSSAVWTRQLPVLTHALQEIEVEPLAVAKEMVAEQPHDAVADAHQHTQAGRITVDDLAVKLVQIKLLKGVVVAQADDFTAYATAPVFRLADESPARSALMGALVAVQPGCRLQRADGRARSGAGRLSR